MKKVVSIVIVMIACCFGNIKINAQGILDKNPNEGLYEQNATGYYKPMQYPTIREADVMWRKRIWRTIDFRQKMNQVFYYPTETHYNWTNFITIILDTWKEGNIVVYQFDPRKDQLDDVYLYSDFEDKYTETITNEDGQSLTIPFDVEQVKMLNIMEDWYFDRQRSQLLVRILAIGPVMITERGSEQLFWISYNNAARVMFAKANFFNRDNPGMVLNYDQVFMNRLFDSYIYKEENPYDRRIDRYAHGVKALYESERIKQEIIDFEQNLWEY